LANIFPTLSRNYDENGNAIVQLSGDTDTVVASLESLLDVQRRLANQQILDEAPDLYEGVIAQSRANNKEIEKLKAEIQKMTEKKLFVDIKEIKRPDREAQLVAESIAQQLENRVSFRRAMKSTMSRSMKAGVMGIKTAVSGRLGGADIARTEFYSEGTIPLQTLRADIDYGFAEADTTYGKLGVKVWIYKGEVLPTRGNKEGDK